MELTYEQAIALNHKNCLTAMEKAVTMIEADAKQLCPVKTSTLKRSITHDVEDNNEIVGVVGSPVEYAYFASLHKPYLEPAVDQNISEIKSMFKEELKKVTK